jgi:ADP-ribosylglycohydrolase
MAMPSHWYYGGAAQVARDYGGPIRGYVQPRKELAGSIMNKSSTGGGGRGSDSGEIIGTVINHGKKQFWTARGSYHYHCTLERGENTLEAQLVRVVCKSIAENGGAFSPDDLCRRYTAFMQTPGSHNDCYASTCHRMFFANLTRGLPVEQCPDNDHHNVDTLDGLVMSIPVALAGWSAGPREAGREAATCTAVTRNSQVLPKYAANLATLLTGIVQGQPLKEALLSGAGREMEAVIRSAPSRQDPVVA